MNNNDMYYKYYDKYDKNIKAIKGGGVITPSNPPNRHSTTDTVDNTWKKNIIPVPPTFKSKYYSNPDLTNGYLNENDYVENDDYISDYYYPSQKMDRIDFINNNTNTIIKNKINKSNPIKFPPPIITTKLNKNKSSYKNKLSEASNKNDNINQKLNNNKLSDEYYNFLDYMKNNSLYDGKYIYTIENDLDSNNSNKLKNITYFPFESKINNLKLIKQNQNEEINYITNINENFENNLEGFIDIENSSNNSISNIVLLVIFSILLIIYFSKYQK